MTGTDLARAARTTAAALACDVCGRLPHPPRTRLTLAKLATIFPLELLVHALLLRYHLPYLLTVALLAVTATVLVVWVVEPSATRLMGRWLHGRAVREHHQLHTAPALWRIRTAVSDEPGSLEQLTRELGVLDVNILGMDVQPTTDGVLDELVLSAPDHVGPDASSPMSVAAAADVPGYGRRRRWHSPTARPAPSTRRSASPPTPGTWPGRSPSSCAHVRSRPRCRRASPRRAPRTR